MPSKEKLSHDPNNTAWSNNKEGFGYLMLTKMGWSKGKGLGAKEDGATEHIKILKKDDNKGIGADFNTSDNWLVHGTAFNDVLARLGAAYSSTYIYSTANQADKKKDQKKIKAKEPSKKRLRYHKLVAAKTRKYSTVELNAIFGKQSPKDEDDEEHLPDKNSRLKKMKTDGEIKRDQSKKSRDISSSDSSEDDTSDSDSSDDDSSDSSDSGGDNSSEEEKAKKKKVVIVKNVKKGSKESSSDIEDKVEVNKKSNNGKVNKKGKDSDSDDESSSSDSHESSDSESDKKNKTKK